LSSEYELINNNICISPEDRISLKNRVLSELNLSTSNKHNVNASGSFSPNFGSLDIYMLWTSTGEYALWIPEDPAQNSFSSCKGVSPEDSNAQKRYSLCVRCIKN